MLDTNCGCDIVIAGNTAYNSNPTAQLATTGTLADLFKGVALRPEFKQRVISQ